MNVLVRHPAVDEALSFIGTPWRAHARRPHQGLDAYGLVKKAYEAAFSIDLPEAPRDIAEGMLGEPWLTLFDNWENLKPSDWRKRRAGDILCFRTGAAGSPVNHFGIAVDQDAFVHAKPGEKVMKTFLVGWWSRRLAYAYTPC